MKKKRFLFILVIAFSFWCLQLNAQSLHSVTPAMPVKIDGDPMEWPQPFRYYDGNTKLQFAIENDTANIYLCFKITDEPTQLRLFNGGMAVWIDPKGKKKETAGIMFPLKHERIASGSGQKHKTQVEAEDPSVQRSDILRLKQHALLQQTTIHLKGFTGVPEQELPLKNDYGINVGFNWDSLNILSIEYKIPVKLLLGHNLLLADTLKPIGLGFLENALEVPTRTVQDESAQGGDMGGNSGMGNNTMGGRNNGMGGMGGGWGCCPQMRASNAASTSARGVAYLAREAAMIFSR